VATHLREGLGMKYFYLGWIPYLLTSSQKATRLEVTKVMIQQLTIHTSAEFQHLLTGNKLLTAYDDASLPMRTMVRNDVDMIARLTSHPQKTMMTIFSALTASPLLIFCRKSQIELQVLQGEYDQRTQPDRVYYRAKIARNSHVPTF
jgi:hypothetical protein